MSEIPTTEELENVKKFPWQWAIITLCGAIAFVVAIVVNRVNKSDQTCEQQVSTLQKVNSKKDSIIFDWQTKYINLSNELLYKNNIIDRQNQVIQSTDSIARKKFEKPAKQIVKQHE